MQAIGIRNLRRRPILDRLRDIFFENILAFTLFSAVIALSLYLQDGSYLNFEGGIYLVGYLDPGGGGILQKIFNVKFFEWNMWQARTLSIVVDYIDAHFIGLFVRNGWNLFFAISFPLSMLFISVFHVNRAKRNLPSLSQSTLILSALLFMSTPYVFWGGNFYRSAKIMVSLFLSIILWKTFEYSRKAIERKTERWELIKDLLFFSTLFGVFTLFDRQAYFLTLVFFSVFFVLGLLEGLMPAFSPRLRGDRSFFLLKWNRFHVLCFGAMTGALINIVYNYYVGPWFVHYYHHFWPDLTYQQLGGVLSDSSQYALSKSYSWERGLGITLDTVGFQFGNFETLWFRTLANKQILVHYSALGILFLVGLGLLGPFFERKVKLSLLPVWYKLAPLGLFLIGAFAILLMNVLMFARHPAIGWVDVRRVYYWIPAAVLALFAATFALNGFVKTYKIPAWLINSILSVLLVLNVLALQVHGSVLLDEKFSTAGWVNQAPFLKKCLSRRDLPLKDFVGAEGMILEICDFFRTGKTLPPPVWPLAN